jgi:hypothetical protein
MYSEYRRISVDYVDDIPFTPKFLTESSSSIDLPIDKFFSDGKILNYLQTVLKRLSKFLSDDLCHDCEDQTYAKQTMKFFDVVSHIKTLRTDYIQRLARPIIQKLYLHQKNGGVFNKPVDPVALNLPTYFDRVKQPMDLGTVRNRLHIGHYDSLESCFQDVRLVFENAINFNGKEHFVAKVAAELLAEFENEIKLLQDKCSKECTKRVGHNCAPCSGSICLLCGERCLRFETPILFCNGTNCGQKIKKGAMYFIAPEGLVIWCQKCYSALPQVLIDYEQIDGSPLLKKSLLRRKFEEEIAESWIDCSRCTLQFHQICAVYSDKLPEASKRPFICPLCVLEENAEIQKSSLIPEVEWIENEDAEKDEMEIEDRRSRLNSLPTPDTNINSVWRASTLPHSKLSYFLENLIKELLAKKGFCDVVDTISIRVTSNLDRQLEVPRPLIDNVKGLKSEELPAAINYRQKCIQLFQTIDGMDVSLFCLYVHEFDANAPHPNQSSVYIAYLDSVDYFRPMQARSMVYQEILVGYLMWSQARGFKRCHIWACPPQRGDSFIFWIHPSHQRTPSRDRLNAWYNSILHRSKAVGVHDGTNHLWEQYFKRFNHRDEAPVREAAKRSFVGSGKTAARKIRRIEGDVRQGEVSEENGGETLDNSSCSMNPFSCPPIFDGDYWVLEFLKLHRIQAQKSKLTNEQSHTSNFRKCRDILKSLVSRPHSVAFRLPVDPVQLCIPTYPQIIKNPMDLGTIREKLRSNCYSFVSEFVQVFLVALCCSS